MTGLTILCVLIGVGERLKLVAWFSVSRHQTCSVDLVPDRVIARMEFNRFNPSSVITPAFEPWEVFVAIVEADQRVQFGGAYLCESSQLRGIKGRAIKREQ